MSSKCNTRWLTSFPVTVGELIGIHRPLWVFKYDWDCCSPSNKDLSLKYYVCIV